MNPATAKKHGAMLLVGAWQELGWRLAAVMGSKLKKKPAEKGLALPRKAGLALQPSCCSALL
jgi:hypothetical protein